MNQEERENSNNRLIVSLQSRLHDAEASARKYSDYHKIANKENNRKEKFLKWSVFLSLIFFIVLVFTIHSYKKLESEYYNAINEDGNIRASSETLKFIAVADSILREDRFLMPFDTLVMTAKGPSGEMFKIMIVDCYNCGQ